MLVVCLNLKHVNVNVLINVLRIFFGFKRTDNMTQVLFELGLPSFNTVLINSRIVFTRSWFVCQNHVRHIRTWLTVFI